MRRFLAFILIFFASVAVTATAAAQSLGEVAERTKKERKGQGGKVYTNDDLGEDHAASQPAAAASTAEAPKPALTMEPAQRWRRDAKLARDAITRAETKVATLQARLDALLLDRNPTNVGDPNRLQSLEAERAKVRADLETAKDELAKARQAKDDLEEEARKSGVPPGWLREP
jgi:hypothetical protein